MYSSRRQRHVSPVMHGWHPDAAAQLHHTKNDCAYDRPQQSFTLKNGHHAPPLMPKHPYSHTLPSHGHRSLCLMERNAGHRHSNTNTDYDAMMNPITSDVFENLPSTPKPETQSTWAMPLSDFDYHNFVRELEAAQTVSPRDLSIHHIDHFPTTPPPQPSVPRVTSQSKPSSSTKSSSHISTPSLTPQTPNGSCSTPETSIDGAAGDENNDVIAHGLEAQRLQRYKSILPAPSRHDSRGDDVALETQLLRWPQMSTHQGITGVTSLSEGFLDTYLPAPTSISRLNEHHQIPSELDWLGTQSMSYNNPEFIDASKLFDFDFDGNGDRSNNSMVSKYPPLIDTRTTAFDWNASRGDLTSPQYEQGLYLPTLSFEVDDDPFAANATRPYTDMFDTGNTIGLNQSTEPRLAGTDCGEGSRRDTTRDDELLRLRSQGISYREIKQKYGFTEAESTLRGRYRTLTKSKDRRVRKPIWKDRDIHLLCDVVYRLAKQQGLCLDGRRIGNWLVLTSEHTLNKISWKKVTQGMEDRGSYPYGFTTTKKKYCDVARGKV